MKNFSLKSRFFTSLLIVFFATIIPAGILIFQAGSSKKSDGYLKLSQQVNLLLNTVQKKNSDTTTIQNIWSNIVALDSNYQEFSLPIDKVQTVLKKLNNEQEQPSDVTIDVYNYPGNLNDTLIINSQLNEWLNSRITEQMAANDDQEPSPMVQLTSLLLPVLNELAPDETAEQDSFHWIYFLVIILLGATLIGYFTYDYWRKTKKLSHRLNRNLTTLAEGNIPQKQQDDFILKELNDSYQAIHQLSTQFELLQDFAVNASKGNFEQKNIFENKGVVGKALADMIENLQQISANEAKRRWANEGIASFSNILRRYSDDLEKLTHEILVHLIKYIDACQGGVFVVNKEEDETYLDLTACYAYERKKYIQKRLAPGQSQAGQCYLEKKSTYLKKVPDNYINIKSGMGGANPRNIFIVPLISNDEIYGVIEIASFKEITDFQQEFIEKNAESIASAIAAVKLNENTKNLLQESQMTAEQLRAQEEEMRQNMEELSATQEEMKRRQDELLDNEAKTKLIYENAFDGIIITDEKAGIDLFNPACCQIFGYSHEEVKGEKVDLIVAEADQEQLLNEDVVGQVRLINGKRKSGELFPLRVKLDKAQVNNQQAYILFLEDISEEETLKEYLKQQNQTLEQNKYNLLALINNSEDTIFAVDNEYKILVVNDKLKNKYAELAIDLQEGLNILELLPKEQKEIWKQRYDRSLAGEKYSFVETKQRPDGQEELLEVFITPIKDNKGHVYGTSVTARDITAYRKDEEKEEQLQAIQEMVEKLKSEKQELSEKLNKAKKSSEYNTIIKEQISNHEYMLQKLQENQQKLKSAMQDEKYIMRKVTGN